MLIKPNPVNWFEIPVTDMQRAAKFYGEAFDIKLEPMKLGSNLCALFPMDQGATGAGGTLIQSPPIRPAEAEATSSTPSHRGTTVYFTVESIDPVLDRIEGAGGKTLIPRGSIGQHGFIAHFEDSEGNRVALHEAPKE